MNEAFSSKRLISEICLLAALLLPAPTLSAELVANPTDWPFSAIGKLNVVTGPGSRKFCSATLIGRRHVLTAAHCLYDKARKRWVEPSSIHFVLGYAQGSYQAHSIAKNYVKSDEYEFGNTLRDYASDWTIIELQTEIQNVKGVPIKVSGLEDRPGTSLSGLVRAGYSRVTTQAMTVQTRCSASFVKVENTSGGVLAHDCEAIQGESGSALMQTNGGEYQIIGVLVATTHGSGTVRALAVPVSAFAAKVADTLGKTKPAPP